MSTFTSGTNSSGQTCWQATLPVSTSDQVLKISQKGTYADRDTEITIPAVSSASTASITTTPVVKIEESGTFFSTGKTSYGVTTTAPSGTDGTNYLKVNESHSVTTTGVATSYNSMTTNNTTIKSSTAGGTANITPTITDNFEDYYIPIVTSVTGAGGGITATASMSPTNATMSTTNLSNVKIVATGGGKKAAVTYTTNTAGAITKRTNTELLAADTSNTTTTATQYINGITLGSGYQFDITNAVSNKVTVKYDSDTNCLDFIFT